MLQEKIEKPRAFRSLAVTLTVAFLLVSLLILLIAISLEVFFGFQAQQKLIAREQSLVIEEAAGSVRKFVQERLDLLKATVNFGNLTTSSKESQSQVLAKSLGLEPSFRQLILFDARGRELARASRTSETESLQIGSKLSLDEITSRFQESQDYLSSVYIYEVTSEPMMVIAVPIKNVFGDFQGVLAAEANLKFMWDVVGGIKVGEKGMAYVVDRQGRLIAFGDASRVLKGENLGRLDEVNEFMRGNEVAHDPVSEISKGIQGNDVVTNHTHIGVSDWAMVIELPVGEAYQSVIQLLVFAGFIFILSLVIAFFVGLFFSKRISGPITSLRNAALSLSKGKLDTRIDIKSRDEIGELGGAFNDMAQKLQTSYQEMQRQVRERTAELEAAKGSLEKQVRERTAELEAAKATLEQQVADRTAELKKRLGQVEAFNKVVVGREVVMRQLKDEIQRLKGSGSIK